MVEKLVLRGYKRRGGDNFNKGDTKFAAVKFIHFLHLCDPVKS